MTVLRSLAEMVASASVDVTILGGIPWKIRHVTFEDSLDGLGEHAASLLASAFVPKGNEATIDPDAVMAEGGAELVKAVMLWHRNLILLGSINPRICRQGESEVLEPQSGEVARIRYESITPEARTQLRDLILGKDITEGKSQGS